MNNLNAEAFKYIIQYWQLARPYFNKGWSVLIITFSFINKILGSVYNFSKKEIIVGLNYILPFIKTRPIATVTLFVVTISSIVFSKRMKKHASSNEISNKQNWLKLIKYTGPIGALIYFFNEYRNFNKHIDRVMKFQQEMIPPHK